MSVPFKMNIGALSVALALAGIGLSAQAALERVGPVNPAATVGNFPAWYQDRTGIALEFCDPVNAELADGWCLIGAIELPNGAPESFPLNFFDEHFYYAASANAVDAAGAGAQLTLAQEAAFATGGAAIGEQVVFARLRLRYNNVPLTGNYRFLHPYGEVTVFADAGTRIFYTEDVGATCTGNFACATTSQNMGPFLLPSLTPGGAELPPITAATPTVPAADLVNIPGGVATPYPGTGKAYITDPARIGPVKGGTVRNFFSVIAPNGATLSTNNFSLMGRLFTGVIPGRVAVDRASYTNTTSSKKVDVFATAENTTNGRMPAAPAQPQAVPALSFFDQACTTTVDANGVPQFGAPLAPVNPAIPMAAEGTRRWAQIVPGAVIPTDVCVRDTNSRNAAGNPVTVYFAGKVTDEVAVTTALFNPDARVLTVAAASSEAAPAPILTLTTLPAPVVLTAGQAVVQNQLVAPPWARTQSSRQGSARQQVSTTFATTPATGFPIAMNDSATVLMNAAAGPLQSTTVNVTANDANAVGGTVNVTTNPSLGTVNVIGANVTYTPTLNNSGTDAFSYTVTNAGHVSNPANVTVTITPVNVAPVAVNDSFSVLAGALTPLNVLGNDTDVNGPANIVVPLNLTAVAGPAAATAVVNGRNIDFRANTQGTYTFTYQARDAGVPGYPALTSANAATVTVQVAAGEVVTFVRAQYETAKARLRVEGTVSPVMSQRIRLDALRANGSVALALGSVTSLTDGTWGLDTSITLPADAVTLQATSPSGSQVFLPITRR
jgi:Bacterial Ig domain